MSGEFTSWEWWERRSGCTAILHLAEYGIPRESRSTFKLTEASHAASLPQGRESYGYGP